MREPTPVIIPSHDPPEGSVLGRIVSGTSSLEILSNKTTAIGRALEEVRAEIEVERTWPYCDYLSLHKLSEFKPYRPYSTSTRKQLRNDEPLFDAKAQEELKQLRAARTESRRYRGTAPGHRTRFALTVHHRTLKKATTRDAIRKLEKNLRKKSDVEFVDELAQRMGLDSNWREVNVDARLAARRPVVERYGCWTTAEITQNEHPLTPYDVRWDALLRKKAFAERLARNVNYCPNRGGYATQDHTCPTLERGEACVDGESRTIVPKTIQADNRPQARQVVTTINRRCSHVEILMESTFSQAADMREMPKMLDVDCHDLMIGDVEGKGYEDAVRHLKARSRWLTEMRIEHKGGPEARSFNAIVSESKFFPN